MNANAPISLVTACYTTTDEALRDFTTVWASRNDGGFHHTAVALLVRDAGGTLRVERSNSTAQHLVWGGALLGGALFVLAPATGVEMLATVGLNGAGAMIYHFRRNTDPGELAQTALLLEEGGAGLVVVVVNRGGEAVTPLLPSAQRSATADMRWGELEEELSRDLVSPVSRSVLVAT